MATSDETRIQGMINALSGKPYGTPYVMKKDKVTPEDEEACKNDEDCQDIDSEDPEYHTKQDAETKAYIDQLKSEGVDASSAEDYRREHPESLIEDNESQNEETQQEAIGGHPVEAPEDDENAPHATMMMGKIFGGGNKLPTYMRNREGKLVKPL